MKHSAVIIWAVIGLWLIGAAPSRAGVLDDVKARGVLHCGVIAGSAGVSMLNDRGEWNGFAVDYCRALAAAVFGDATKVDFKPATLGLLLEQVKTGAIDILATQLTDTASREIGLRLRFVGPTLHSGLTFMVPKALGVSDFAGLNGATICLVAGTISEEVLPEYFRSHGWTFKALTVSSGPEIDALYDAGRCDAFTTDRPLLMGRRQQRANPADHIVLPGSYAQSDTGPVVRAGDDAWYLAAQWTFFALAEAEALGITKANVMQRRSDADIETRRFLGGTGDIGTELGLPNDWTVAVIRSVGNYAEVWNRNWGSGSAFKLTRQEDRLERDGGSIFVPTWK